MLPRRLLSLSRSASAVGRNSAEKPGTIIDWWRQDDVTSTDVFFGQRSQGISEPVLSSSQIADLWNQHAAALQLLARARCSMAEDCVQEAFARLATEDPAPEDAVAWLARVVRNEAISQFRRDQRRRRRENVFAHERGPWLQPADSLKDDFMAADEIQQGLLRLDAESREIIIAHLWTGLSFRQIAEAFETSSSAVHRQYHAALSQLRDQLGVSSPGAGLKEHNYE